MTLSKMRYLGLDLAWAPRATSAGAVMEATEEGVRLVSTAHLRAHEDVLSWSRETAAAAARSSR